jgi:hypothetical protein
MPGDLSVDYPMDYAGFDAGMSMPWVRNDGQQVDKTLFACVMRGGEPSALDQCGRETGGRSKHPRNPEFPHARV